MDDNHAVEFAKRIEEGEMIADLQLSCFFENRCIKSRYEQGYETAAHEIINF